MTATRGEVIGADFSERDDGRIVVHVAVAADTLVSHQRVVMQEDAEPSEGSYRIALRPDHEDPTLMDDIVVKDVSMFRAEQMGDGEWFACCYLNGEDDPNERVAWWISAKCRPRRIEWVTTEYPDVRYEDRS